MIARFETLKIIASDMADALAALDDGEACQHDHNGNCQAHGVSNPCEVAEARKALGNWQQFLHNCTKAPSA